MLLDALERRSASGLRAEGRTVRGYAILFDSLSLDLGGFKEVIAPSAVDRTLAEAIDVRALVDHKTHALIGRVSSKTLRLAKDERGLKIEIDLPKTTVGDDVLELVGRGDLTGMSFQFEVVLPSGERWENRAGFPVRTVTNMRVTEVSIVTFPAYDSTSVAVAQRSLAAQAAHRQRSINWLRLKEQLRIQSF